MLFEGRYNAAKQLHSQLHYIWLNDTPVGFVVKNNNSEDWKIYAIHTDHLNTPRLLTNQNGAEVWRWASDAFGLTVQFCKAPAQIAGGFVDHHWIKTDTKEAGMGGNVANAGDQYESMYVTDVYVRDHSGQSKNREGASCEPVDNVDENRVNEILQLNKPLGKFSPFNNCQTFARDVLNQSRLPRPVPNFSPNFAPALRY